MALPVDPKKIKEVAEGVIEDLASEVKLNVYVDTTCNPSMIDSISKFLSGADDGVTINFIDIDKKVLGLEFLPDFGIILAGSDKYSVLCYKALQIKGVPALILGLDPNPIIFASEEEDVNIFRQDFICPALNTYSRVENNEINFSDYNKAMDNSLKSKIVDWMYIYSDAAQVSYALNFPFLRPAISRRIINACAIENAGLSMLKILPGIDMPLCIANQVKMLLELAAIYGYEISVNRIVEIIFVIASNIGLRELSSYVSGKVPVPKFLIDGTFGLAGTELLGLAAREYFSRGLAVDGLIEKCKSLFKK